MADPELVLEFNRTMDKLRRIKPAGFLAVCAAIDFFSGETDAPAPAGYSRGDFKRAVRELRRLQVGSDDPEKLEGAVALIRRAWLKRG